MLAGIFLVCSCAPRDYGPAESFYAARFKVTDAGVRHVGHMWDLRVDDRLLSDVQDAILETELDLKRQCARAVLQRANRLACQSAAGEIRRLPPEGLESLAATSGRAADADALVEYYESLANRRRDQRLHWLESADGEDIDHFLRRVLRRAERQPDEKGRWLRIALLHWGTIPALIGIENTEARLEQERERKLEKTFEHAVVLPGGMSSGHEWVDRFCPVIVQERRDNTPYSAASDRFGKIYLAGQAGAITVRVDTQVPTVYYYLTSAKIGDKICDQIVYVWWYPRRPAMIKNDPAAGSIDGVTLRITLDSQKRPAIFEIVQACGCGHLVYVSDHIEKKSELQYGAPLENKAYSVENDAPRKRDLLVAGIVRTRSEVSHAVLFVEAGYHSVITVAFTDQQALTGSFERAGPYRLLPYASLDELPLADGVGSMFGADGLVHHAGRREGYLLAPTGMLSAGQPRKRGTQKIRWDDYDFDDPRLLEKTLRLPSDF